MSSSAVLAGLGLAAVGIAGRAVVPLLRSAARAVENPEASKAAASAALPKMPEMKLPNWLYTDNLKFEKGGFKDEMTRSEAARTLGVGLSSDAARIKDAHRRLMRILHPDNNGSAYLSMKVNEAKDLLIKGKQKSR